MNVNLAILLRWTREEDLCMQFTDENWMLIFSPLLKSKEAETRFVTHLVASSISHHFYDENILAFDCTGKDKKVYLTYLTRACEVPCTVSILHNLVSIPATQILLSLTLLMQNLNVAFAIAEVFGEVVNLLVNGGLPEIKAACAYMCALGKADSVDCKSLVENSPLPVQEILEQIQDIEDTTISRLSERALQTINGSLTGGKKYYNKAVSQ